MSKSTVTFDFDHTLAERVSERRGELWIAEGPLKPIDRVVNYLRQVSKTHRVHIVSFRKEEDRQEMIEFVELHGLPVERIVCTSGAVKTPFIQELDSILHVDDSVEVLVLARLAGIPGLLVDHGQEETNSTAKLFDKI